MDPDASALISKYQSLVEALLPRLAGWALDVLAAVGILVLGWLLARISVGIARRTLGRHPRIDPTITPFIESGIRTTILIIALFAAVERVGVRSTSILAVVGAAGLAIGLALQGTLSNVAAGVMLLLLRPLRVEEYIDADGTTGTVKEVGLFNTLLLSPDGLSLYVPNAKLWGATIRNHSRLGRRRLDIAVRIAYEGDAEQAIELLTALLVRHKDVLSDPPPAVLIADLAESSVLCSMQAWVRAADFVAMSSELRRAAKHALDEAGIGIAHAPFLYTSADRQMKPGFGRDRT